MRAALFVFPDFSPQKIYAARLGGCSAAPPGSSEISNIKFLNRRLSAEIQPIDAINSSNFSLFVLNPSDFQDILFNCLAIASRLVFQVPGRVQAFRKVLPKKSVGIFIGTTLPRIFQVTDVDPCIGCQSAASVTHHFRATIPSQ